MTFSDESYNLRIELNTQGCELTENEISDLEDGLFTLRNLVEKFPVSNLYITVVHHGRTDDYHVKTSLALPGKKLFTGDRDTQIHPAYERCIRKLVKKVQAYKQQLRGETEYVKQAEGTHQRLSPSQNVDVLELEASVNADDFASFRRAVDVFESALSDRIGRWIQRYPEIESQLGQGITISDIVEDVMVNAFDRYPQKPEGVPTGMWLESLIDPTVQALIQSPDEEFANISFARAVMQRSG